jgi:hypothetical protein
MIAWPKATSFNSAGLDNANNNEKLHSILVFTVKNKKPEDEVVTHTNHMIVRYRYSPNRPPTQTCQRARRLGLGMYWAQPRPKLGTQVYLYSKKNSRDKDKTHKNSKTKAGFHPTATCFSEQIQADLCGALIHPLSDY